GSERTARVTYTADVPLPSDLRDALELSLRLPDGEAGDAVEFPVTQTCEIGETVWAGDDAPTIVLTAGSEAEPAPAPVATDDVLARTLGGLGLALGTIGVVLGISARRKAVK